MGARASKDLGQLLSYPMAATTTITAGDSVMINSAGYAVVAVAAAANKGCVGVAVATVVNSGAAGAAEILVQEGTYLFVGVGLTQSEIGDIVFFSDAQTFSNTQAANEPRGGILVRYVSATSGWVKMGVALAS